MYNHNKVIGTRVRNGRKVFFLSFDDLMTKTPNTEISDECINSGHSFCTKGHKISLWPNCISNLCVHERLWSDEIMAVISRLYSIIVHSVSGTDIKMIIGRLHEPQVTWTSIQWNTLLSSYYNQYNGGRVWIIQRETLAAPVVCEPCCPHWLLWPQTHLDVGGPPPSSGWAAWQAAAGTSQGKEGRTALSLQEQGRERKMVTVKRDCPATSSDWFSTVDKNVTKDHFQRSVPKSVLEKYWVKNLPAETGKGKKKLKSLHSYCRWGITLGDFT